MSKVALVTGAGIRLGRAIALELARSGFDLLIHANQSRVPAEALGKEVEALGRKATVLIHDLSKPSAIEALANEVPAKLDVLVNNAGIYEPLPFMQVTREAFERVTQVNLYAPFFLTQALIGRLRAAEGSIVNITDMAVDKPYREQRDIMHYLTSKAGLAALTKVWAVDFAPQVRVNAVAPGPVAIAVGTSEEERQKTIREVPLRREGTPEDVARAVAYFATAPYVTGQTLRVDGGLSVT
jgi:pteridine reductase